MAWTYSNYVTYSPATAGTTRLSQLRLHIQEVTDYLQLHQENSSLGKTQRRFDLVRYLEKLQVAETELEKRLGLSESANSLSGRVVHAGLRNRVPSTEES